MRPAAPGTSASPLIGVDPASIRAASLRPRVLVSFPPAAPHARLLDGLALGPDGHLYASVTTRGDARSSGQIVRVSPRTGEQEAFGPAIATAGQLTGVAFDAHGRLYVADAAPARGGASGVHRVARDRVARVLTLPRGSSPGRIAVHDGRIYVSDGRLGAIWRARPDRPCVASELWLRHPLLLAGPAAPAGGVNGIAFRDDGLYAAAGAGRIVRIAVLATGAAGEPVVVAGQDELRGADGIAFDPVGSLWIVTGGPANGRLEVLTPFGALFVLADRPGWLDDPTIPVYGSERGGFDTLYVANGSLAGSGPNVIALGGAPRLP